MRNNSLLSVFFESDDIFILGGDIARSFKEVGFSCILLLLY